MTNELLILDEKKIQSRIYTIRGQQVMLDKDLAELYGVLTGNLNKAVKRNIERFHDGFMFRLSKEELDGLESDSLRFQNGILETGRGKHSKYPPYAFTEQGVAMLSAVLKSHTAITTSLRVINAFVSMRRFLSRNAEIFSRIDNVERKQVQYQIQTDNNFKKVFDAIESKGIVPDQGIFFDGKIFDAYKFVSDLVRSASKSIILIDNYVDDSVLTLLCKRNKGVSVRIFTRKISKQLELDAEKCNSQYPPVEIIKFAKSHDRFLIIDNNQVYHVGASLKDLGKRWFAFSRMDKESIRIFDGLKNE